MIYPCSQLKGKKEEKTIDEKIRKSCLVALEETMNHALSVATTIPNLENVETHHHLQFHQVPNFEQLLHLLNFD